MPKALAMRLVGRPIRAGLTPNYARLCLPYVVAATLRFGTVGLADFTAARLADPLTHALAARVRLREDGNPDPNAIGPQAVEIRRRDGTTDRVVVETALGSPANPLPAAARRAKLAACAAAARQPLPPAQVEALAALAEAIEAEPDAARLARATRLA